MSDLVERRPIPHIATVSELADWMYEASDQIETLESMLREARPYVAEQLTFNGRTTDSPDYLLARIDAALKEKA